MFTKNTNFDLTVPSLEISKLINNLNMITNKKDESFLIQNVKFKNLIIKIKNKLKNNKLGILLRFGNKKKLNPSTVTLISKAIIDLLGKDIVQDDKGNKLIFVFDRDRKLSINSGDRYHQTREGGSIHTDNVNLKDKWDFLLLSCLSSGEVGGDSILVSGNKIYNILKNKHKLALKILMKNFLWERRGIEESFYKSPIIKINKKKQPEFRYLRPYMVSAHQKMKKPLTPSQLYALDVLDSLLENPENQIRFKLIPGDILLSRDAQVLHGRTSFSDYLKSRDIFSKKKKNLPFKRTMIRAWIKDTKAS